MNVNLTVFVVLIITSSCDMIKAQKQNFIDKKYAVIIPDDYQREGKSYPLVVCYQNQITDSLFQRHANKTQTVILQFYNATDTTLKSEFLKETILKTMHDFNIAKGKIYLLGVNQNINKTAEIHDAMNYYFAATAYITNDQDKYTSLKNTLKLNNNTKLYFMDAIDNNALETAHSLFLQHYLWELEVEKLMEEAVSYKVVVDKDTKKNWQASISYGQWYFDNSAKSKKESFLEFSKNMGAWNLSCARYFKERLSVNVNLGILVKKIEPIPDVASILGGADVEIEGGGIFFMPVSLGMDYAFMKQRFRPYAGFGLGIVPARYKYVEASGNIADGINRVEKKFNSNVPFVEISTGFNYRTGKNTKLGLNCDYIQSKEFSENIGGFKAYNGFKASVVFSILF